MPISSRAAVLLAALALSGCAGSPIVTSSGESRALIASTKAPAPQGVAALDARARVKEGVAFAKANRPAGRLWCVPFARTVSGVDIRGNARNWWAAAEGRYERGQEPRVGAVMAFAASRAMPRGHVAVVSKVLSEREILIDHANWDRNRYSLDQRVVDVSEKGDWSAVRVTNADGSLGRINPVSGFIYD
jgi:surface antigen